MTISEKIEMYKHKKLFIDNISKVFEIKALCSNVVKVDYEVYVKEIDVDTTYFVEYLIVRFPSGAKSVRCVNGNSNNTNFRELGKLIDGGYYDEVKDNDTLYEQGFEYVALEV